jgi:hypothetical protein
MQAGPPTRLRSAPSATIKWNIGSVTNTGTHVAARQAGSPRAGHAVRLRIARQPSGCIDGIRLDGLVVGVVYDIGTTLGCYLLAQDLAVPVDDDVPAIMPPWTEARFSPVESDGAPEERPTAPLRVVPKAEAADRPPRRRRKR